MRLIHGDALEVLRSLEDNSIDAVVTDPPYGLKFMGHKWDYDVPTVDLWKEVYRVLKPGGHLLSFFGTRTYHRGVVNIEDAGFEIRDMVVWLYGEGFPKSQALDKLIDKELGRYKDRKPIGVNPNHRTSEALYRLGFQGGRGSGLITEPATPEATKWKGWGTALKPACEPIVLARKALSERNIALNVLKWGTGGLNIDACRIPLRGDVKRGGFGRAKIGYEGGIGHQKNEYSVEWIEDTRGRFPANVILDETSAWMLDEQSGTSRSTRVKGIGGYGVGKGIYGKGCVDYKRGYNDSGGASRFFYVAKAKGEERYAYCKTCKVVFVQKEYKEHEGHEVVFHPTVKPVKLMRYLVRLVTPPGGVVLDPFMGTGSTGVACALEGIDFIGIEIDETYYTIAQERLRPYMAQRRLEVV